MLQWSTLENNPGMIWLRQFHYFRVGRQYLYVLMYVLRI
jgi:hypothetical protein